MVFRSKADTIKNDTARKLFINTVALPGVRTGVLPTISDEKMLFLGPMDNPNLKPEEREELKRWVDTVNRDPRARQRPAELDVRRHSTLLDWARQNAQFCSVPEHTGGHFDSGYKVSFGPGTRCLSARRGCLAGRAGRRGGGRPPGGVQRVASATATEGPRPGRAATPPPKTHLDAWKFAAMSKTAPRFMTLGPRRGCLATRCLSAVERQKDLRPGLRGAEKGGGRSGVVAPLGVWSRDREIG